MAEISTIQICSISSLVDTSILIVGQLSDVCVMCVMCVCDDNSFAAKFYSYLHVKSNYIGRVCIIDSRDHEFNHGMMEHYNM